MRQCADESGSIRMSRYGRLYPSLSPRSLLGHEVNVTLSIPLILLHRGRFDINMQLKFDMLRGPTSSSSTIEYPLEYVMKRSKNPHLAYPGGHSLTSEISHRSTLESR